MYKCKEYKFEKTFRDFQWKVRSIFIDRVKKKVLIEIVFDKKSRTIETNLTNANPLKALALAKSKLADEVIEEQNVADIIIFQHSEKEKFIEWHAFNINLIAQINADFSNLTPAQMLQLMNRLKNVTYLLQNMALEAALLELQSLATDKLFETTKKDEYIAMIQAYLNQWK
jgi:hypothetical protein